MRVPPGGGDIYGLNRPSVSLYVICPALTISLKWSSHFFKMVKGMIYFYTMVSVFMCRTYATWKLRNKWYFACFM